MLTAFCDANWVSCNRTKQSLTGYFLLLGGTLVSWRCKKHLTVAPSTEEAKYRIMTDVCCEITWLVSLLFEMQCTNLIHVYLFFDNQTALYIASNHLFHERIKTHRY